MGIQMDAHQKAGACTMMIRLSVKISVHHSVVPTIWSVQEERMQWDVKCQIHVCLQKTPAPKCNRERRTNEFRRMMSLHQTTTNFVDLNTKIGFELENNVPSYANI